MTDRFLAALLALAILMTIIIGSNRELARAAAEQAAQTAAEQALCDRLAEGR